MSKRLSAVWNLSLLATGAFSGAALLFSPAWWPVAGASFVVWIPATLRLVAWLDEE